MWQQIIELVISNGIFALLFCFLLYNQMRDGRKREEKYQQLLTDLSASLTVVNETDRTAADTRDIVLGLEHDLNETRDLLERLAAG